jgi:uncharacterized Rossmann fold enzyme
MEFTRWEPFYRQIIEDFEFDEEEDFNAGKLLSEFLADNKSTVTVDDVSPLFRSKDIYIFGGGPSLKRDIPRIFKRADRELMLPSPLEEKRPEEFKFPQDLGFTQTWIAADIATSTLLDFGIVPNVIVTDLDGIVEDILLASELGATVVVHAHGDNQDKIRMYTPKFKNDVLGTMQATPEAFDNLINYGGFTDGDRAVYLADGLGAKNILLIAFNFRDPVRKRGAEEQPRPEEDPAMRIKAKKLTWANVLIAMLDNDGVRFFDER